MKRKYVEKRKDIATWIELAKPPVHLILDRLLATEPKQGCTVDELIECAKRFHEVSKPEIEPIEELPENWTPRDQDNGCINSISKTVNILIQHITQLEKQVKY